MPQGRQPQEVEISIGGYDEPTPVRRRPVQTPDYDYPQPPSGGYDVGGYDYDEPTPVRRTPAYTPDFGPTQWDTGGGGGGGRIQGPTVDRPWEQPRAPVDIGGNFIDNGIVEPPDDSGYNLPSMGDIGLGLGKGVVGLGESIIGLGDIATGGYFGEGLKGLGYRPGRVRKQLEGYESPGLRRAQQEFGKSEGWGGAASSILRNPGLIGTGIAESLPYLAGSAGIARGAGRLAARYAPKLASWAPAFGEGVLGTGSHASQVREETGNFGVRDIPAAFGSGLTTATLSKIGGRAADKLGLSDIDKILAGQASGGTRKLRNRVGSALVEGLVEEAPQSGAENEWINAALGKPFGQGTPAAMTMGAVTGTVTGGVAPSFMPGSKGADPSPSIDPNTGKTVTPGAGLVRAHPAEVEAYEEKGYVPVGPPDHNGNIPMVPRSMGPEIGVELPNGDLAVANYQDWMAPVLHAQGWQIKTYLPDTKTAIFSHAEAAPTSTPAATPEVDVDVVRAQLEQTLGPERVAQMSDAEVLAGTQPIQPQEANLTIPPRPAPVQAPPVQAPTDIYGPRPDLPLGPPRPPEVDIYAPENFGYDFPTNVAPEPVQPELFPDFPPQAPPFRGQDVLPFGGEAPRQEVPDWQQPDPGLEETPWTPGPQVGRFPEQRFGEVPEDLSMRPPRPPPAAPIAPQRGQQELDLGMDPADTMRGGGFGPEVGNFRPGMDPREASFRLQNIAETGQVSPSELSSIRKYVGEEFWRLVTDDSGALDFNELKRRLGRTPRAKLPAEPSQGVAQFDRGFIPEEDPSIAGIPAPPPARGRQPGEYYQPETERMSDAFDDAQKMRGEAAEEGRLAGQPRNPEWGPPRRSVAIPQPNDPPDIARMRAELAGLLTSDDPRASTRRSELINQLENWEDTGKRPGDLDLRDMPGPNDPMWNDQTGPRPVGPGDVAAPGPSGQLNLPLMGRAQPQSQQELLRQMYREKPATGPDYKQRVADLHKEARDLGIEPTEYRNFDDLVAEVERARRGGPLTEEQDWEPQFQRAKPPADIVRRERGPDAYERAKRNLDERNARGEVVDYEDELQNLNEQHGVIETMSEQMSKSIDESMAANKAGLIVLPPGYKGHLRDYPVIRTLSDGYVAVHPRGLGPDEPSFQRAKTPSEQLQEKLREGLKVSDNPKATHFVLDDGTPLTGGMHYPGALISLAHESVAEGLNTTVREILDAGAMRYADGGAEVRGPITRAQAQYLADYRERVSSDGRIYIDLQPVTRRGNFDTLSFDSRTANAENIYNQVNEFYKKQGVKPNAPRAIVTSQAAEAASQRRARIADLNKQIDAAYRAKDTRKAIELSQELNEIVSAGKYEPRFARAKPPRAERAGEFQARAKALKEQIDEAYKAGDIRKVVDLAQQLEEMARPPLGQGASEVSPGTRSPDDEPTFARVKGGGLRHSTAQQWDARMRELDARRAPDTAYRDIMSTAGKNPLKRGETWRGRVQQGIEYFESTVRDEPRFARTKEGRYKASMNTERGITNITRDYTSPLAAIMSREGMQNHLDAADKLGANGEVKVKLNNNNKTIEIHDNGAGMDDATIGGKLFEAFSSGKEGEEGATGGKGIGSAAYIYGGSHFSIISTAYDMNDVLDEDGNLIRKADGLKYRIESSGTPEQFMKGQAETSRVRVPDKTPTGTTMKTTLKDDQQMMHARKMLRNILKFSRNRPSSVIVDEFGIDTDPIEKMQPRAPVVVRNQFADFANDKMIGNFTTVNRNSQVKVLIPDPSSASARTEYNVHYLNNGMYQFTNVERVGQMAEGVPEDVIIDVHPMVEDLDELYPFINTREDVKGDIRDEVTQFIENNISKPGISRRKNRIQELYDAMEPVPVSGTKRKPVIFDPGNRLTPREMASIVNSPVVKDLIRLYDNTLDDILGTVGRSDWEDRLEAVGLVLDPDSHGIHIPNPATGKSMIGFNPFLRIDDPNLTLKQAAWKGTITTLHEAGHIGREDTIPFKLHPDDLQDPRVGEYLLDYINHIHEHGDQPYMISTGHGFDFSSRLGEVYAKFRVGRTFDTAAKLEAIYRGNRRQTGFRGYSAELQRILQLYQDSRGRPAVTEDLLSRTGVKQADRGPQGTGNIPGNSQANRGGATQPGAGVGGGGSMPPPGMGANPPGGGAAGGGGRNMPPRVGQRRYTRPIMPANTDSLIKQLVDVPRSITTTLDFSALRQGFGLIHSPNFWKAIPTMFHAALSDGAYTKAMTEIRAKPLFQQGPTIPGRRGQPARMAPSYAEQVGMRLDDLGQMSGRSEGIANQVLNWVPGFKRSNQAFTIFLNKLRADSFEYLINDAERMGLNPMQNVVLGKEIAEFVNTASGRGPLTYKGQISGKTHSFEHMATVLSATMFSPRLFASRVKMLTPSTYIHASPFVRRQYLMSFGAMASAWGTVGSLAALAGAEVSLDTNDPDFGKIKIGDTRLDPAGGYQQYLVAFSRLVNSTRTSSATGREQELGQGLRAYTKKDVAEQFITNKFNPLIKFAYDLADASEYKPFHIADRSIQMFVPLIVQDMLELMSKDPKMFPTLMPMIFGWGSQTYSKGESSAKIFPALQELTGYDLEETPYEGGKFLPWERGDETRRNAFDR